MVVVSDLTMGRKERLLHAERALLEVEELMQSPRARFAAIDQAHLLLEVAACWTELAGATEEASDPSDEGNP